MYISRIEYGCLVYRSEAKLVLAGLDIVQAMALKICTGAVRSSPVCSTQTIKNQALQEQL